MNKKHKLQARTPNGFTIVELLIVVVVIGILSTLILVAYNGVQIYANSQSAKTGAVTIQKKIESYGAIANSFPTDTAASTYTNSLNAYSDSSLSSTGLTVGSPNSDNGTTTFEVSQCASTAGFGYRIRYWDFAKGDFAPDAITGYIGSNTCSGWNVLR